MLAALQALLLAPLQLPAGPVTFNSILFPRRGEVSRTQVLSRTARDVLSR